MDEAESDWRTLLVPLLGGAGIAAPIAAIRPLGGGVSSDIVAVELEGGGAVCAKRALPQLRVANDWHAPVERNRYEVAYLRVAGAIVPGALPRVIAEDREHGIAVLEYLPPDEFSLWKDDLLGGRVEPETARLVGDVLGRIHRQTFANGSIAARFATDSLFDALRLDPYLQTLARRFPDLAPSLLPVIAETRAHRQALVHGDVSPKNILVARRDGRPVLLDAECAWYGDPAFDAAFCLNHLLLKAVHLPHCGEILREAVAAFFRAWAAHLPAPKRGAIEARVARLLPALMLARIDGKSPVDYLSPAHQDSVRALARPLIVRPALDLPGLLARLA